MGLPVVLLRADRDKVRRAMSITDWLADGRVKINTPKLKRQMLSFRGRDEKNDLVDAFVHCVKMIRDYSSETFTKRKNKYKGMSWEREFLERAFDSESRADTGGQDVLYDESYIEKDPNFY